MRLGYQILLKPPPPPNLTGGIRPSRQSTSVALLIAKIKAHADHV